MTSLVSLCIDVLVRHIAFCPSLKVVPTRDARQIFDKVVQAHGLTPQTLRLLSAIDLSIGCLDLRKTTVVEALFRAAITFRDLDGLLLQRATLTPSDLKSLKTLRHLKLLSLEACAAVSDATILILRNIKQLAALNLSQTNITSVGVANLSDFPDLQELRISWCTKVTSLPINLAHQLKKLDAKGLSNKCLEVLSLAEQSNLVQLNVSRQPPSKQLQTATCPFISNMIALAMARNHFADQMPIKSWTCMKQLRVLDLHKAQLDDDRMNLIWNAVGKHVAVLLLGGVPVTDLACSILAALSPSLTHLDLSETAITNAGVEQVSSIPTLKRLSLRGCAINKEQFYFQEHILICWPHEKLRFNGLSFDDHVQWLT